MKGALSSHLRVCEPVLVPCVCVGLRVHVHGFPGAPVIWVLRWVNGDRAPLL